MMEDMEMNDEELEMELDQNAWKCLSNLEVENEMQKAIDKLRGAWPKKKKSLVKKQSS